MIEHTSSAAFHRAHRLIETDLDRRAARICEAWILWSVPFNVFPDAGLMVRFQTAEPASLPAIARQITAKLVKDCPVQMPMPASATIIELLDADEGGGDLEYPQAGPFDFGKGPTP